MDRREAIKYISYSLGITISIPTILSTLNSCSHTTDNVYTAEFLNKDQQTVIVHLVDLILPKSDIPGGLDLNLIEFIDKMLFHTINSKEQKLFNEGAVEFSENFQNKFNKSLNKGKKEEYDYLLKEYFVVDEKEKQKIFQLIKVDEKDIEINNRVKYLIYKFLIQVRKLSLLGFYTSKVIIEKY